MFLTNSLFDSVWNAYIKDSMPLASAIIGAFGGGIVSGFLVHWLTRSREQEAWVRNCEKEEWKELFTILTEAADALSTLSLKIIHQPTLNASSERTRYTETADAASVAIDDKLFIAAQLSELQLGLKWTTLRHDLFRMIANNTCTQEALQRHLLEIHTLKQDMRKVALKRFARKTTK